MAGDARPKYAKIVPRKFVANDVEQVKTTTDSTARNVTDDREACPKNWHIAIVRMNCERRVARQLTQLGVENFVALQREVHIWSDRLKHIDRVVIPMTVFLRADAAQLLLLREVASVSGLMRFPGEQQPAIIPAEQIDTFREMLKCTEADVAIEQPPLAVGETLRIVKGSLRGLCGEVIRTQDNKSHIIVRLGCLGCASIDLPSDYVQRL